MKLPAGIEPVEIDLPTPELRRRILETRARALLLLPEPEATDPHPDALPRLLDALEASGASAVYGDFLDAIEGGPLRPHALADWQEGSLTRDFPMGPLVLWSVPALRGALDLGALADEPLVQPFYALRLFASRVAPLLHLPEPLAVLHPRDRRRSGERVFDYLTAAREAREQGERLLTRHLGALGALLRPPFEPFESREPFPVEASVVIPVRDRVRTLGDAVRSALGQRADFAFNVIVVDNHSTDGTTALLAELAAGDLRLVHHVPVRRDLGIGGCWNEALFHPSCGRWVVQLDSDDLYASERTLARMVEALIEGRAGMAVGAYTLVDFALREIPPGLIDHREWSDDNGPNNALGVGGLGAPRAFATELARRRPFPNASYGEDYAMALRLCRRYRVERIYDSVYLCRRWEDNTDADLPPELAARHQLYKDRLRTLELGARRAMLRGATP